jgi:hypothetical protein
MTQPCIGPQAGIVCEINLVSITKYLIDFIIKTKVLLPHISWRPVLVVEEAGVPRENHRPWASNW